MSISRNTGNVSLIISYNNSMFNYNSSRLSCSGSRLVIIRVVDFPTAFSVCSNGNYISMSICAVMSDSARPHRRQPTRLPRPWDSPGKNTGVGCHFLLLCMQVKSESEVVQSCPTLSDCVDCSPPGSSIHGIFQARVLEWVAFAFSVSCFSCVQFFVTLWTIVLKAPLSMGFSKQEY